MWASAIEKSSHWSLAQFTKKPCWLVYYFWQLPYAFKVGERCGFMKPLQINLYVYVFVVWANNTKNLRENSFPHDDIARLRIVFPLRLWLSGQVSACTCAKSWHPARIEFPTASSPPVRHQKQSCSLPGVQSLVPPWWVTMELTYTGEKQWSHPSRERFILCLHILHRPLCQGQGINWVNTGKKHILFSLSSTFKRFSVKVQ